MTFATAAAPRQERQLVAGRYRLVSLHRQDDHTEVWRALDEETAKVVTLEFLRSPTQDMREQFFAQARRLQAQVQPTAIRVAAIHEDPDAPFVVFEHLVSVPIAADALQAAKTVPEIPQQAIVAQPVVEQPSPALVQESPVVETPTVALAAEPPDHGLAALNAAWRARDFALVDSTILKESALELWEKARAAFEDLHLEDIRFGTVVAEARALFMRVLPLILAALVWIGGQARALLSRAPRVSAPRVSVPKLPKPAPAPRMKAVKEPKAPKPPKAPKMAAPMKEPRAASGPRFRLHIRWGRVLFRGLSLSFIALAIMFIPLDLALKVSTEVGSQLYATVQARLAAPPTTATQLSPAPFDVPPLKAYGAAFESQGPYPSVKPSGQVEWVVALRNTGSAGWYRGIDGAQASLALSDGTSAAVQSTPFVAPGQVGWFVVQFKAPDQPGTYRIKLNPRIDGRGLLPDLGIFATVTVVAN